MFMSELARYSPPARYSDLVFNVDIRAGSTFAQARYSGLCRMSMSDLTRHSPSSIFETFAECRCQIWLDIRPPRYPRLLPNVDVSAGSTFAQARYSGLLQNVDVRSGSTFAQLDIRDFCRISM
ncbi:hypothetical protein DPMN_081705 [Dreissena polymorpha]|uniref:Uncharacterized protein n=1 Tax=Dreissena polymorpha TaxID=45954 RepID=A0A9D3Y6D6_DREPO|nr:hypothetical protein DPMN_081705 [Dreissena polymorpha]